MKRPFSSIIALLLCLTVHGQQKDTVVVASHARGDDGENSHISGSLNLINILNQSGANGTISAADLMTDTSLLHHYLMSGSYIRPFTMELSLRLEF